MNLSALAIRQPVTVAVGIILVILAGLIALQRIPIQLTPNVEDTIISVTTFWEGASPREIEQEIVDNQEDKLQGLANLLSMTSSSQQGVGRIRLEFAVGTRKEDALREVSDKLREVPRYPENADEPVIEASDPENRDYIAWIVFETTDPELDIRTLLDFAEDRIKPVLERVEGMAEVNVLGGREREAQIRYDPMLLAQRGIPLSELVAAIRRTNRNLSAGDVADAKRDVRVRTVSQYESVAEVKRTVVRYTAAGPVFLGDVADVVETFKEPRSFVRSRGRSVIAINAQREVGANVMEVMAGLKEEVAALNLPGGVLDAHARLMNLDGELRLTQVYDQTIYIDDALALVRNNIWIGGALAITVLLLFLRSLRSAGIIALAIPISVVGAIVAMVAMGRSINVISLAGMAFAVGMVVDNAIVVLENIYRHLEMGKPPREAAIEGAREVWVAILAATLTTIAVFIPILLVEEEAGQLFRDIALAICAAVGLSLVVSITVIPSAAARIMRDRSRKGGASGDGAGKPRREPRAAGRIPGAIAGFIYWLSGSVLARLGIVILLTAISFGGTWFLMPPADYLPQGNRNLVFGLLIPPSGYNLDQRSELASRIEVGLRPFWEAGRLDRASDARNAAEKSLPAVPTFDWFALAPGDPVVPPPLKNYFTVSFEDILFHGGISDDPKRAVDLIPLFQHATRADLLPGVLAFAFQVPLFSLGGTTGSAVKINLSGDDLDEVAGAASAAYGTLAGKYGYHTVQPDPSNFNIPGPELQVIPRRVHLSNLGLTPEDLGLAVRANGDGAIIGEYRVGGDTIDLKLIARGAVDRTELAGLENLPISTPSGHVVPLESVAHLRRVGAPTQINRVGRRRSVTLQFSPPAGLPLEQAVGEVDTNLTSLRQAGAIPAVVETSYTGSASKLRAVQEAMVGDGSVLGTLGSSLSLALVVVYLLLCVLFQSFLRPLVILFSVPLATLGGFAALFAVFLWSTADRYLPVQNLDVLTMLGFVILIGVVVNNAILIVHQSLNFLRGVSDIEGRAREPLSPRRAIAEAVRTRVRPIFMSTLTSVGGMAPLVFMPGSGSELYRGLGSVVIGGLLVSTVFTLLLVPLLLSLVTDLQGRLGLLPGGGTAKEATPRPEGSAGRPRRGAAMLLPLSLFAAGLLGGCRAREARATSDDFKRLVENIVEREMAGIGAEEGTWRITAQPKTEVRDTLGERLDELERMAGPAAYEGAQTRLGPDLEGGPQGTAPLTLAEAVATAVKNNLGIEIARLQGEIAAEGVREAEAFFDPAVYSGFDLEKLDEPTTVPVLNGIALGRPVRASEQESLEVGLRGRLTTGATLSASTLLERFENDTLGIAFSPDPAWQSRVGVNLTQPLLRGSGSRVSTAEIALRRNDRRRRENDLRARVLDIAAATEEAYWDLVSARHGLLIQQRLIEQGRDVKGVLGERRDFDTAPAQYADAVATVEQRQAELLRLRRRLRAASDRLKHLLNDPELPLGSETLIEPADPLVEEPLRFHLKGAIVTALRERPEVEQAILGIDDAALREDVARNLRLPELNLTAGLSYAGLEDGAADAYGELSTDSFVSYLLGVTFELPFGNRAAKAVHRRARLEGQSARLLLRQVVQEVVREVKEALRDVETSYALIEANRSFRIAQSENLRALLAEEDTQRSPTPEFLNLKFLVQERLALARRQEIDALADYSKALAAFHRALGTTKDRTGVPPGDADGR